MARHVCDNCGSVVSEDEQFCPNCGAWIDPTSEPVDEGEYEEFSLESGPPPSDAVRPPVQVASQTVSCPSCGTPNPDTNRHCEECGARLSQGTLPVAPRPAVQATAGVRAAMAISALLFGVVLIALLFNIFSGDDEDPDDVAGSSTTSSTTTTVARVPEPINILSADCSISGLSGFECRNLIDSEREYQINWEELEEDDTVTIDLIFPEPMVVTGFVWENLPADTDRFFQNYRARSISLSTDGANALPLAHELDDQPGRQAVEYVSMRTLSLTIEINTVYLPEERNGRVFTELAIAGIEVVGYPAGDAATTTTTEATEDTSDEDDDS